MYPGGLAISGMTGATIFGCAGPRLSLDEAAFFRDANPWGFILFARNIETPSQVKALTEDLRKSVSRNAPILIDQEGGRVARLSAEPWREWLPPLDQVDKAGNGAARSMFLRYRLIAAELLDLGIDVNCAPMADIATANTHPFLFNRCYGRSVGEVVDVARAVATGLLAGGVLPVLKHIPGHGRGAVDSHEALPIVETPPEVLQSTDFAAFQALADLPLAMTAHVVYSAFDDQAATISRRLIRLIREELGFDGLLMTDDISMNALGGSVEKRATASLLAGCDVVLHCNGDLGEMAAIADVAGQLSAAAHERGRRALSLRRQPQPIDTVEAELELEALLQG